jgi:peptidoglycan/xylan/chitin deacetylase (PgdA/CDA1 family)
VSAPAGARAGADTTIVMYHGTPRRHAARLERQFRFLAFWFDVVPLQAAGERRRSARRRVVLTFDDGLRSNFTVAYSILHRLGLPATFFVCPGLIESGRWLWNHEARQRLLSLQAPARSSLARLLDAPEQVEPFIDWMKAMKAAARKAVEQTLRDATPGFRPSQAQREHFDLADWNELRSLDPRIAGIGSHGMTHALLTSLDPLSVERELAGSRLAIESQLGREAAFFCYPNGDYDDVSLAAARRHYRAAVTTKPGKVAPECDPHRLPRFIEPPPGLRGLLRLARRIWFH